MEVDSRELIVDSEGRKRIYIYQHTIHLRTIHKESKLKVSKHQVGDLSLKGRVGDSRQ
jgi:hypothetical protein